MKKAVLAVAIILMSVSLYNCTPQNMEDDKNLTEQSTNGEESIESEKEKDDD
ncbi:hypothetical protein [uncultured Lacinutrix sp.]|uniref:hypothetical protein n=1 Tax=uncultured Lacinutrix sp. TaxID=574032 RepID=UPI0026025403|nr:hypothetical protein [uncultured Lacinutrix sp.]